MEGKKCFAVVGGDARQAAAARALARAGFIRMPMHPSAVGMALRMVSSSRAK